MMKPGDLNDRFGAAYNARNLEALLALYERDALLDFGPHGPVRGLPAIGAALEPFIALGGKIEYTRRFCMEVGDLALLSVEYRLKDGRAPDGSAVASTGVTLELARRQPDGSWKYVIDLPQGASPGV